ncbi:Uncharacterized membrane-anchored protein YjiN, DUF445 family [Paenibacillus sp. yr247]|uniref:DUF445 domain-containing protein n=1 Tax=Paenibacillus sp. yr247 TaxID=1761880 RepID=UPI000884EDA5|nr:DUF445 domain-containing protein [Paenibacillus sp. yr247]SDO87641.1 Uncharacterized membrane-anchored protein YjiN, DUF445 family [Paenibacillus sp. yr247]
MMNMKTKAHLTLLLVTVLFIVSVYLTHHFPDQWWTKLLIFMAEAGLVGGLADLFAVTALFKRPMGLPFPHTAIIPTNRNKLIDGIVSMVEKELLNREAIKDKLAQFHIVNTLIQWVEHKNKGNDLSEQGWKWITGLLSQLDITKTAQTFELQLINWLRKTDVSPFAGNFLTLALDRGEINKGLDYLIDLCRQQISSPSIKLEIRKVLELEIDNRVNEGNIFSKVAKKAIYKFAETTNSVNIDDAVEAIYDDLIEFVNDLSRSDHELRLLVIDMLGRLARNLDGRSDLSQAIDTWKQQVLDHTSFAYPIESFIKTLIDFLQNDKDLMYVTVKDLPLQSTDIRDWGGEAIRRYWNTFKNDEVMKDWLEEYAQQFLRKVIEMEHHLIGQIVRETLTSFTKDRLVSFVQEKVGEDLQRIRINGSLVGGFIGGILFLFLHLIYFV